MQNMFENENVGINLSELLVEIINENEVFSCLWVDKHLVLIILEIL
jgi:hypothetical protein